MINIAFKILQITTKEIQTYINAIAFNYIQLVCNNVLDNFSYIL